MIKDAEAYCSDVRTSAAYISGRIKGVMPEICIVLGSGLSPLTSLCSDVDELPYSEIPGFPVSTAPGHKGVLFTGTLEGKRVFMMSGRFHHYEGYDTSVCTFYVRVMALLGVKTLLLTNAAGGMDTEMMLPGFMIITDHLSFHCDSPLIGQNLDMFGDRFPDQSYIYDREYISLLEGCAAKLGINISKGIYAYSKGPQYETPAEIRALHMLGASAVGMSTVPEAIAASHSGIKVAAFSCITNLAAGLSSGRLSGEEVIEYANRASDDSCALVREFIRNI